MQNKSYFHKNKLCSKFRFSILSNFYEMKLSDKIR